MNERHTNNVNSVANALQGTDLKLLELTPDGAPYSARTADGRARILEDVLKWKQMGLLKDGPRCRPIRTRDMRKRSQPVLPTERHLGM